MIASLESVAAPPPHLSAGAASGFLRDRTPYTFHISCCSVVYRPRYSIGCWTCMCLRRRAGTECGRPTWLVLCGMFCG